MGANRTVSVDLKAHPYKVHIGEGLLAHVGEIARESSLAGLAAILTDEHVAKLYSEPLRRSLEQEGFVVSSQVVESGESSKSLAVAERVCEALAQSGINRRSFIVALGGGVIGDLAGFVAAIYYRGIPVIHVPTTVMAQVDSSIGGKTAVNLRAGKNLVGAFHQPRVIIADTDTLKTLGRREWNEGFAEVIKYGVIRDASLLSQLEQGITSMPDLVEHCVKIKASYVVEDEFETTGNRALLNFGHTLGHAIEAVAGYGKLLHGEAIALGMIAALDVSVRRAGLSAEEAKRVKAVIERYELPNRLPGEISLAAILSTVFADKKFVDGRIRFVVSPQLGKAVLADDIVQADLELALDSIR
jgi:3-dehydroquinate synthase